MIVLGMCIGSFLMVYRIWQYDNFPDLTAYVIGALAGLLWGGVLGLLIAHIADVNGHLIYHLNDFWSGVVIILLIIAFLLLRVIHTFRRDLKNLEDYE